MLALIAVTVATHLLRVFVAEGDWREAMEYLAFSPDLFFGLVTGHAVSYPYMVLASPLGHAFLHGGWGHLAINMAFTLALATGVERRIGSARLLIFYFLSALGGALAVSLVNLPSDEFVLVVGASGAISGLFAAIIRMRPGSKLGPAAAFLIANLLLAATGATMGGGGIAWDAHIGGFVIGWLIFPVLRPPPPPQRRIGL